MGTNTKMPDSNILSDKIDFETKAIRRDEEECYIMKKGSIEQKEITFEKIYVPPQNST